MCNKREESLKAMTMLATMDDDDDVSRGELCCRERLHREKRGRRDGPWAIDGRAGLETRNLLPVDKQVMTPWKINGGGEVQPLVIFFFFSRVTYSLTTKTRRDGEQTEQELNNDNQEKMK